jgi:hypothetical protein
MVLASDRIYPCDSIFCGRSQAGILWIVVTKLAQSDGLSDAKDPGEVRRRAHEASERWRSAESVTISPTPGSKTRPELDYQSLDLLMIEDRPWWEYRFAFEGAYRGSVLGLPIDKDHNLAVRFAFDPDGLPRGTSPAAVREELLCVVRQIRIRMR